MPRTSKPGASGDIPAPGDYDGDTEAGYTVFRPSDGTWHIIQSSSGRTITTPYGATGEYSGGEGPRRRREDRHRRVPSINPDLVHPAIEQWEEHSDNLGSPDRRARESEHRPVARELLHLRIGVNPRLWAASAAKRS